MTGALAIPPPTVKNRPCALIRACALNLKNTVFCISKVLRGLLELTLPAQQADCLFLNPVITGVRLRQETEEDRWAIGSHNFIAR